LNFYRLFFAGKRQPAPGVAQGGLVAAGHLFGWTLAQGLADRLPAPAAGRPERALHEEVAARRGGLQRAGPSVKIIIIDLLIFFGIFLRFSKFDFNFFSIFSFFDF
jgi:hypothetical protein